MTGIRQENDARRLPALAVAAAVAFVAVFALLGSARAEAKGTVWLCKPGLANNPCGVGLKTTMVSPTGDILGTKTVKRAKHPKIDCFYVYPTVSDQHTSNANLHIDPEERSIALYQAARYSQYCRVFAPMYRQLTLAGIANPSAITPTQSKLAYGGVLDAWKNYLSKYNHGRGVVFIGHSQGSYVLRQLIAEQVDPKPAVRKLMLSALLLGGNVEVKKHENIDGDFKHIPGCKSNKQLGCVVGLSTFNAPVPDGAVFGRPGGALGGGDPAKRDVLCTNPAALGGGTAPLDLVYPSAPFAPGTTIGILTEGIGVPEPAVSTPWIEFRGAYKGHCSAANNAHVLQISPVGGAPVLHAFADTWGLHLTDANIALGNLVDLVRDQIKAYFKH
jgi:hypothetical protein